MGGSLLDSHRKRNGEVCPDGNDQVVVRGFAKVSWVELKYGTCCRRLAQGGAGDKSLYAAPSRAITRLLSKGTERS